MSIHVGQTGHWHHEGDEWVHSLPSGLLISNFQSCCPLCPGLPQLLPSWEVSRVTQSVLSSTPWSGALLYGCRGAGWGLRSGWAALPLGVAREAATHLRRTARLSSSPVEPPRPCRPSLTSLCEDRSRPSSALSETEGEA